MDTSIPSYKKCLDILIDAGTPYNVIDHCIETCITAMSVTQKVKRYLSVNCDLVLAGSLLHDIGRSKSHSINHGIIGAKILAKKGLSHKLSLICERHIFAGIKSDEAKKFGLPEKDYTPMTIEEKIVAYSDNISKNGRQLTLEELINRNLQFLNPDDTVFLRIKKLYLEIQNLTK